MRGQPTACMKTFPLGIYLFFFFIKVNHVGVGAYYMVMSCCMNKPNHFYKGPMNENSIILAVAHYICGPILLLCRVPFAT